jgi:hypothetical protein
MYTATFAIISSTQTSALLITTTPAHEYQAQTVAGVFKVVFPVKNEHKRIKYNCQMISEILYRKFNNKEVL